MSDLEGIAKPGPELAQHIRRVAASLSKKTTHEADVMMKKVITSARREEFLFFESNNIFHPFFLSVLNEMRTNPSLADEVRAKAEETKTTTTTATATSSNNSTPAAAATVPAKLLRSVQEEAFQQQEDPHPVLYTFDVSQRGTLSHAQFATFSWTAQYAAKFGPAFLSAVLQSHAARASASGALFKFLHPDDPWHQPFLKLVNAYATIVLSDPEVVEERLEALSTREGFLATCSAKRSFLTAEIARRKAALLTDDDLRQRLEWDVFTVLKSFTVAELGLEQPTATVDKKTTSSSTAAAEVVVMEDYEVQGTVARNRRQVEAFVDATTKLEVKPEELSNVGLSAAVSSEGGAAKRPRENLSASSALAGDDEFERNLKRARGE